MPRYSPERASESLLGSSLHSKAKDINAKLQFLPVLIRKTSECRSLIKKILKLLVLSPLQHNTVGMLILASLGPQPLKSLSAKTGSPTASPAAARVLLDSDSSPCRME